MLRPLKLTLCTSLLACLLMVLSGCPGEAPGPGDSVNGTGNGGSSAETKRIVILTNGDDPFWDACESGSKHAEEVLKLKEAGLSVTFDRADFTVKGQVDKLKQFALQKDIVALGISVYNPDAKVVADQLKKLQESGIKVITIDGDINREKYRDSRFAYLGTDNFVGGRELGRAGKALLPEGGKYVQFVGNKSAYNAIQRMDGFVDGSGDKLEEIARTDDSGDRAKARKNVVDALNRNSDLNMLVGIWAYNTPQAVSVVKQRKIRDKTKVVCFDAAEASISAMKDGNVDIMVVQNPYQMGFEGVKLMKAMIEDDQAIIDEMYPSYEQSGTGDIFNTELRVVVPNADSPIKQEILEESTIYMTLEEFQAWLAERGLKSS